MTAADFRRIALGMIGAVEGAHMGHPDFRANGRIFATIHPDHKAGMVKLTPDQQQAFVNDHPVTFAPENGAWGRQGCTRVSFDAVDETTLGEAMTLAWQNSARKLPPARSRKPGAGSRSKPSSSRARPRSPRRR